VLAGSEANTNYFNIDDCPWRQYQSSPVYKRAPDFVGMMST